jgi:hypothetical protein
MKQAVCLAFVGRLPFARSRVVKTVEPHDESSASAGSASRIAFMEISNSMLPSRRWLQVGLTIAGTVAGAVFGLVLTRLGKIVAGAPPATLANYAWNAGVFGVFGGIVSPIVSWSALRRVPLWRTIVEPLAYALAGGAAAVVIGSGALLLALPPLGLVLGFVRLRRRYPEGQPALPSPRRASTHLT